jgi:ferritin-like metal-binding protein YciE
MPAIADLNDLFNDMLRDIYYAEKKIYKTLPKLAKAVKKNTPALAQAFEKHHEETEGQVERLEQVFNIIGKKASAKKCEAIEGILEEGDELIKNCDCPSTLAAGLLAGAQAVEHYEIARYGTLIAWAKLLGYDDAADLLQETLDQEKNTDSSLNELAVDKINQAALDAMKSSDESNEDKEEPSSRPNHRRAA